MVNYGVNSSIGPTIGQQPINIDLVTPFIPGAWPADTGNGNIKTLKKITSYEQYKSLFVNETEWGELKLDDGWSAHKPVKTILEAGCYPIFLYNAFDPATMKTAVVAESKVFAASVANLTNKYVDNTTIVLKSDESVDKDTTLNADGADYVANEVITLESIGGGAGAKVKVLTVDGLGAILTFEVIDGGTGFTDSDAMTQTSTTGIGTGATFVANVSATAYSSTTDYTISRASGTTTLTLLAAGKIPAAFASAIDYSYMKPDLTLQQKKDAIDKINNIFSDTVLNIPVSQVPNFVLPFGWGYKKATIETTDDVEAVRNYIASQSELYLEIIEYRFVYDIDETAYNVSKDTADLRSNKTTLHKNGYSVMGSGTLSSETECLPSAVWFVEYAKQTVANNFPGITASNKPVTINGYVPTNLFIQSGAEAQELRDYGIICATKPWSGGNPAFWGTYTSKVNGTPDAVDYAERLAPQNDINVHVLKQITLDLWETMYDRPLTSALIDAKLETWNNTLANLVSTNKLIAGRLEFREEDNPDITNNLKFRLIILGPLYSKTIEIELNVDLNAIRSVFPTT